MIPKIKQRFWNTISSGLAPDYDLEVLRKIFLLNLIMILGGFFLALLGSIAIVQQDFVLAAGDFAILAFIAGLFIYLRKSRNHQLVGFIGTIVTGCFYFFLIAYGGVDKTAYVWAFTYPLIALFLLGKKLGSYLSLLLLGLIGVVFAFGTQIAFFEPYSINLILRFIPAYITIWLFAFVMEKVREIIQQRLKKSKTELEKAFREVQQTTLGIARSNRELQAEITERKRIEKALRDSDGFLEDVIESIQDGISVLNPDLTIRHTNSVMKQWYRDSLPLVGKKCFESYRNEKEPCQPCPALRSLESGRAERDVVAGLPGSPIEWLEVYSFPIKDKDDGRVIGVVEFVRDISERKRLETQLAQAERMDSIGRLAGGVAHDFNNLLMGIQGRTSLMLADVEAHHPFVEHLAGIETYVKNAADLTRQLLGFARGGKYEVKAVDVNKLIAENAAMFGRTKKELNIITNFSDDIWPTDADQGQINQVFLNLFVNAWEAMPQGGDLNLKTENISLGQNFVAAYGVDPGRYIKISVSDTGIGMDETTRKRLFDPFFTTKDRGRGTGLGLASAYGIVKNHNGIITVKSKPGRGTTFSVYLPASEKKVVEEKQFSKAAANGSETVLLVDDEDMVIEVGSKLLQRLGYKVLTARNGFQAVEIYQARQSEIDCIVLDMIMPDQNGGQTFDKLKQIDADINVLLSSGYSLNDQASAILSRGCNGFIQKPFNLTELSWKIREILEIPN
jgi:two-component system cell cycle sensor histidine kinase/response regulator CckA